MILDGLPLEDAVRRLVLKIMLALYNTGITEVHLGGMMRILGVDNETAQLYDDEAVVLDSEFAKYVSELYEPRPSNETLH